MGEGTTCNYCNLEAIRARARNSGAVVEMHPATGEMGGTNVYIVPRDRSLDTKKHFVAWMWTISEECAC